MSIIRDLSYSKMLSAMAQQRRSQCRVRPAVIGAVVVVMIQSATGGAQKVRGRGSSCRSCS